MAPRVVSHAGGRVICTEYGSCTLCIVLTWTTSIQGQERLGANPPMARHCRESLTSPQSQKGLGA